MEKEPIYAKSILTFAYTLDGKIIVKKDKDGKLDTLPLLFMGHRERGAKIDYEDSIGVISDEKEYETRIAEFFGYYQKATSKALIDGFVIGNPNALFNYGRLLESIHDEQITEIIDNAIPGYISVGKKYYDYGENQLGQGIINEIETRYLILPKTVELSNYNQLEAKELDEIMPSTLTNEISYKMFIGTTGEEKREMQAFINTIKQVTKSDITSPKK